MRKFIKQAFFHLDSVLYDIQMERYDFFHDGSAMPRGKWETVVQPGWEITMKMWKVSEMDAA